MDQMLVLKSEDFFARPSSVFQKVLQFLELPPCELREYKPYNAREYSTMNAATRKKLTDYFEPHNRRLRDLLGDNFAWNG
jgi:hypothetical protein